MALPKSVQTENNQRLQAIVNSTPAEVLSQWPSPTADDLMLIGGYVVMYSYIDFNLRRIVEAVELVDELRGVGGKADRLTITDVEKAILAMPEIVGANRIAIERIVEFRGLRNLLAHFAVRRFPNDDAFLFVTRSARDFKREFGRDAPPGEALTAILEVDQVRKLVKVVEDLLDWLSKATVEIEGWEPKPLSCG
jgi:hypothetical protein